MMVRANGTTHSHDFTAVDGYTEVDSEDYLSATWGSCGLGHTNCIATVLDWRNYVKALNSIQATKSTASNGFPRPNQSSHSHDHTPKKITLGTWWDLTGWSPMSCPSGHAKCVADCIEGNTYSVPATWSADLTTFKTSTETRPRANEKGHQHDTRWEDFSTSTVYVTREDGAFSCPAGHTHCRFDYSRKGHLWTCSEHTGTSTTGWG